MLNVSSTVRRAGMVLTAAGFLLAATACQQPVDISRADVSAWKKDALPAASGIVLEDSGKILDRDPIVKDAQNVAAGQYTLTMACDGGGKAFFAVSTGGQQIADAGAACNGSRETVKIKIPATGAVIISTSSVDAPLIYAYQLAPATS
ncbi:hypothetical protein DM794_09360 [Paenarthrobacter ureafaciens]|uniref:hypothetical protein n=1 Tax=Paenarthrobacter TaxID=1742992 RepID=UPI00074D3AE3|nr:MULTISPECIES: hypothetical protein [Paenarthrobacter]AMB41538.1 hypothetical protein AUT26_15995 [Arthrobacter sp. ATCC 21022]AOY69955.1 hypothetical protein ARZXY2_389 [Arthrobacter sp. ZXY-2]KUR66386.1 hypothetical protein JM67_00320 [Arthrobacter sp. ATCC 21022]NWL27263.1 hypothetical protein [Paenarthrobacter ureafaciens]QSZ52887.1 hypothetical protein AYX19_07685 [Paenarthrobacter ureafaciens]